MPNSHLRGLSITRKKKEPLSLLLSLPDGWGAHSRGLRHSGPTGWIPPERYSTTLCSGYERLRLRKEAKTLDAESPETGGKSSVMDRLKSAKIEK